MLSDYFHMTLDELVRGIDVQDVRDRDLTGERVTSIYLDLEKGKAVCRKVLAVLGCIALCLAAASAAAWCAHLIWPDLNWLWQRSV